jgi:hypothetical protein
MALYEFVRTEWLVGYLGARKRGLRKCNSWRHGAREASGSSPPHEDVQKGTRKRPHHRRMKSRAPQKPPLHPSQVESARGASKRCFLVSLPAGGNPRAHASSAALIQRFPAKRHHFPPHPLLGPHASHYGRSRPGSHRGRSAKEFVSASWHDL